MFEIATGVVMASYRVDAVNAEARPLVRAMRLDLSIGGMLVSMSEGEQDREAALTRREADVERREADLAERLEAAEAVLAAAEERDVDAEARDDVAAARDHATDRRAFVDPDTKNYVDGLVDRRHAALDREHAKDDRSSSADDRQTLTGGPEADQAPAN